MPWLWVPLKGEIVIKNLHFHCVAEMKQPYAMTEPGGTPQKRMNAISELPSHCLRNGRPLKGTAISHGSLPPYRHALGAQKGGSGLLFRRNVNDDNWHYLLEDTNGIKLKS